MDNRPIGILDSGLGGLTVVKAMNVLLPNENIVYLGDTARMPYGNRDPETLLKFAEDDIAFLKRFDVKMIVAACGTISSVALHLIEEDLPLIGVVNPAAHLAARIGKRIAVLGTQTTIRSHSYKTAIEKLLPSSVVYEQPCPPFVPIVEEGHLDDETAYEIVNEYLLPIKKANADTVILGCTHYSLLSPVISEIMGSRVNLIDTGLTTAMTAKTLLEESNTQNDTLGKTRFFVSGNPKSFAEIGSKFIGYTITDVGLWKDA